MLLCLRSGMPIAPDRVRGALETIRSRVVRTPLLESPLLNELVRSRRGVADARVFVKAECLQHTGAFKFRGALHKLLCMDDETRGRGVCAFSSGNFAQAGAACLTRLPRRPSPLTMSHLLR